MVLRGPGLARRMPCMNRDRASHAPRRRSFIQRPRRGARTRPPGKDIALLTKLIIAGATMPDQSTPKANPAAPPRGVEARPQAAGLSADEIRQIVLDIVG